MKERKLFATKKENRMKINNNNSNRKLKTEKIIQKIIQAHKHQSFKYLTRIIEQKVRYFLSLFLFLFFSSDIG